MKSRVLKVATFWTSTGRRRAGLKRGIWRWKRSRGGDADEGATTVAVPPEGDLVDFFSSARFPSGRNLTLNVDAESSRIFPFGLLVVASQDLTSLPGLN